jgi:8-hydroxy-5-deazaflavin:NADPH oxidoreductase
VRQPGAAKVAAVVKKAGARARALAVREAAAGAGVVVLAVSFDAVEQAIAECGNLTGKIVIDCNNPLLPDLSGLTMGHTDSCGEMVAHWAKGARVVKTLNTTGSGNMLDPRYGHEALSMFLCGDDADAKKVVTGLVAELGFEPVDAGPLTQARYLEPLAMLWISMAYGLGQGPNFGFRVLRR